MPPKNPLQPQQTPPCRFLGEFSFPCCGEYHRVISAEFAEFVRCPRCQFSYAVRLSPVRIRSGENQPGDKFIVSEDVEVVAGTTPVRLLAGQTVQAANDLYGMLGVADGEILIEVHPDPRSRLIAPIKKTLLEKIQKVEDCPDDPGL